ncbi:Spermatogenesis-associated protein 20 [Coccomyxa sp. Obi]|nr:Spermatogenesis-associated protein 20 [Coccomyxa sp. Obi]
MASSSASFHGIDGPHQKDGSYKYTNRLAREESPYLLQHAHNPVDWYPWGEEAFEKARREDKPIFLSVGYATCHWCHVMERESFESEAIAELMNENFVNIKVDKEERSDVDRVYMTYVQAISGGGGWPMSVFLTPDLQPFLGGTYFPPQDAYGRPGFATVLKRIADVWRSRRNEIIEQSADTMRQLSEAIQPQASGKAELPEGAAGRYIESCYSALARRFDATLGGFGAAPKFPRPAEINLLLVEHLRVSQGREAPSATTSRPGRRRDALGMAEVTLQKMAAGGMYDHVGGGFHRYSVDEHWHVPHFEKMLYDNGQLAQTYLDAYRVTGDPRYARVARGILDYLHRDMTHPDGGFYSAEDADSMDKAGKKAEGAFYMWSADEIDEVLGTDSERSRVFKQHYYVKPGGNTDLSPRSDPHEEFGGLNCLIERESVESTATKFGLSVEETEKTLAKARQLLHERRAQRPRPHLDDKVVTAWNGLTIGACANASRVLANEQPPPAPLFPVEGRPAQDYLKDAIRAAEFARDKVWDAKQKRLRRSFCRGPSDVGGFADDYAFLISGLLDLHAASGDEQWLRFALQVQEALDELFWDDAAGGYFSTTGEDPSILLRMKEDYDGAEPAPSSIAVANLARLAALADPDAAQPLIARASAAAAAFRERLSEAALAMPQMCCALHLLDSGHLRQVIIAGRRGAPDTEALLDAAQAVFAPDKAVIFIDPSDKASVDFWREHNPQALAMVEGANLKGDSPATAFVCQNFTCKAPTSDPKKLKAALAEARSAPSAAPVLGQVDLSALGKK